MHAKNKEYGSSHRREDPGIAADKIVLDDPYAGDVEDPRDDGLNAARGIINGVFLGLIFWILVFIAVKLIF